MTTETPTRRKAPGLGGLGSSLVLDEEKPTNQTASPNSTVQKQPVETKPTTPSSKPAVSRTASKTTTTVARKSGSKRRVGMERKYGGDLVKSTSVFPTAVHDKLQDIIHSERKSSKVCLNDLVLQGIDLLFKQKGIPSIEKLVANDRNKEVN